MNKKYLPFILIGGLIVFFVVGLVVVRNKNVQSTDNTAVEQEVVVELPNDQKPTVTLTSDKDGHLLNLRVQNIKVPNAKNLEYELTWTANNTGVSSTQGTSGTIQLNGQTTIERSNLLLGSESSGKKRYDIGVQKG